jgi:hypothetical protein
MINAVIEDEERKTERLAWQTAHLMNATGNMKRPVRLADLFQRRPRTPSTGRANAD